MKNKSKSNISNITFSKTISSRSEPISAALEQELKDVFNIKTFFNKYQKHFISQTLSDHLNHLLFEKGKSVTDVIHDSFLDASYVHQIFNGRKKAPSRDKLISIAFGLHLTADETQKLLNISGNRKLYVKDRRDAIILFSIHNNKDVGQTNSSLIKYGCKPLEGPIKNI